MNCPVTDAIASAVEAHADTAEGLSTSEFRTFIHAPLAESGKASASALLCCAHAQGRLQKTATSSASLALIAQHLRSSQLPARGVGAL
jgi:hypothetical protein